jgi:GntR family transcriptional repressor for pyruvate dehydrogenase complex
VPIRFEAVARRRAYEEVAHRIERAIILGEVSPGERLPSERQLTVQFAVSRATVREALRSLEIDGFVESRPNDPQGGTIVRSPSSVAVERSLLSYMRFDQLSLREVVEFRMFVESATAYLAASHRSEAQLAAIVRAHEALQTKVGDDSAAFSAVDVEFHHAIAEAAGNRLLRICNDAAKTGVRQLIGEKLKSSREQSSVMLDWIARHERIVEAIRSGDAAEAYRRASTDIYEYYSNYLSAEDADHAGVLAESAVSLASQFGAF